jgi:mercuric ion transport protein
MSGKAKGYWLAAVAALTCPCHIPLLILAFSGTAAGALLADYTVAALALMTIAFVLSLRAALRAFDRPDKLGESR